MWGWVLDLAIKIAVQFGIPFLLEKFPMVASFVKKYFPNFEEIISNIIGEIKDGVPKKVAVRRGQNKMRECRGVGCASDLKKD